MRERDFAEFKATANVDDREELADLLAQRYGDRGDVLCGFAESVPVCIGGTIETWPGVMSLLFFATDDFPQIGRVITRFIRRELFPRYEEAGIHRIQAISLDGYEEVHAWLRAIGMKEEASFPAFGKAGETFVQFSRIAPCS
jgi:hypothetical protein